MLRTPVLAPDGLPLSDLLDVRHRLERLIHGARTSVTPEVAQPDTFAFDLSLKFLQSSLDYKTGLLPKFSFQHRAPLS
jgi:hypothetical protein